MFVSAKLKYFRQHQDLEVIFENGVVALRGDNEAGKTTLLEAIGYAMGGVYMLREPLSEVVTWGQKDSALKVWVTIQINGMRLHITRSKSGAEIRNDNEILATGQGPVTEYIETQLGCEIKTATQLMLASQQELRGTLEKDGAAMKLIEQLADFQFIDRSIALVQKHLPAGTTVSVEARVATLKEQVAQPVVDDTGSAREKVAVAILQQESAGELYAVTKAQYDEVQEPARLAQQRLDAAAAAASVVQTAETRLATAKVTLEGIKPVPGPDEVWIAGLRKGVEDAGRWQRAANAHARLQKVPEPQWEGSYEDLVQNRDEYSAQREQALHRAITLGGEINTLKAQKITASACGLCGKDLANVPEVVTKNAELDERIAAKEAELVKAKAEEHTARNNFETYNAVVVAGASADATFNSCAEFITLDRNFTPAKWAWTGPDITKQPEDPTHLLREAEQRVRQYQMDLGRQQQAQEAVMSAEAALGRAVLNQQAADAAVGDATAVLEQAAAITSNLYEDEQNYRQASQVVKDAEQEYNTAKLLYDARVNARQQVVDQLAQAEADLAEMVFNNELVDALRKARPSIVEELWNLVSAGVSDIFSRIRGTASVFARVGESFTVDGHGIKGLSGSTLDALGLAIRMMLTKTFLPNTRFLVLDEPASAADDNRETNMLGVIAAGEFEQVILVTHSDLADSFANQVVRL